MANGLYAEQLKIWRDLFDENKIYVFSTEELHSQQEKTMNLVYSFLGLKKHKIKTERKMKAAKYSEMKAETKNFLIDFYKPHNEKLFKMIGKEFDWSK